MEAPLLLLHAFVLVVLSVVCAQALLNFLLMPRLRRGPPMTPALRVAVLIPARNEAEKIEACVRSWLVQEIPEGQDAIVLAASGQLDSRATGELQDIVGSYLAISFH